MSSTTFSKSLWKLAGAPGGPLKLAFLGDFEDGVLKHLWLQEHPPKSCGVVDG